MIAWALLISGAMLYAQGFLTALALRDEKRWQSIGGAVSGFGFAMIIAAVWLGALREGWFA